MVTLLWRGWTISRWTWQDDDWVYLADAASMPLGDYMLQMYNGHLMPGEFLIMWVITYLAPLNFTVPLTITAVASALIVLLWGRALATVAGESTWVLMPLALLSLSPLLIRPTMWWASALQVLPLQACLAWGVLVAARMATRPTRRDTAELLAALAVALFFWEKAVLLVLPFVMVLVSARGGTLAARVRLHRWPVAALATLGLTYSGLYLLLGRQSSDQREKGINFARPPTVGETSEFMGSGLGNLLAPGALGGPWGTMPTVSHAFSVAAPWINVATSLTLALVVALVLLTRVGAWLPVAGAAVYTLISWALVLFSSRFVNLGTIAINDERYSVDCFSVVVLGLVLGVARPARSSRGALRGWFVRPAVLGVPLVVSLVLGNVMAVQRIGVSPAKHWVDTLTRDLGERDEVSLVESTAPDHVLAPSYWLEYAKTSRMLSPLRQVSFTEEAPQLRTIADSGRLVPVDVSKDTHSEPGPVEGCGYSIEPGATVAVPMSQELFSWTWVVRIDTFAAEGGEMVVDFGDEQTSLQVRSGLRSVQLPYSGAVAEEIRFTMDGGATCLTSVVIGNARPSG